MNATADMSAVLIPPSRPGNWHFAEELVGAGALAAMVLLPMVEIGARAAGWPGLAGSGTLVQHLTLVVGMAGAALAAGRGRLLAFASSASFLPTRWQSRAHGLTHAGSAAVTFLLAVASARFVAVERESASLLLDRIPLWWVQSVLPLGFALMTGRLLWRASTAWRGRLLSLALAMLVVVAGVWPPCAREALVWPGLVGLLLLATLGAPLYVPIGGAALLLFQGGGLPIAAIPVEHYRLVTNPALPSIPLFTLAGCLMAEGGAARRLVALSQALVGWFHGGPAVATALLCAFFTALTGGSGVTILALGGLLMPVLRSARYSERDALGLLTGAGSLGILLPPCLPVILYAVVAKVGINEMFLGGLIPGLLLIGLTIAWGVRTGGKNRGQLTPFNLAAARRAIWTAKWELLLPVVALGALFSGRATPVEAAAVTAAYAFIVETCIHRDLHWRRDLLRVLTESVLLVGGILLILGVALGLTNYLIDVQAPDALAAWAREHVPNRWLFLLGLNVVLIVVGGIVEIYAAIVVVVPLLLPVGRELGLDPIHLGILFLANLELGFLMPPVGLNLLLAASRLNKPVAETARAVLPMLLVLFLGVLLITYVPALTTALPQLFQR
ncbi:TRAP transporter large permease subunit [Oleiharenicola lentus]|uniref:TRAP transporter large permease subunit n=1 Tax=Oleiharenicola lentus TaxID=2508720 RepID=A0A4Q1C5X2_9BACT|nr:TRAP transporter large permease subunit [Oleiharenicola lentus]RXK53699.1 TRAP transporter large permease subunit [Oleiharenicola lentus]